MEKFLYICNESELIKLIEAFGDNLQVDKDIFFHNENVFVVQKDEKGELIDCDYKDELFKNHSNITGIADFAEKIAEKINQDSSGIIYISVHPGGTSEEDISKVLNAVNTQLNNKEEPKSKNKQNFFVTYHGSKNTAANDFFSKNGPGKNDLTNLNKAIKNFIEPDIKKIFKKYKSNFLIELNLLNEFFDKNNNVDKGKLRIIFGISNANSIKKYKDALDNVNKVHKEFYDELGMIQKNDND